jgi:DNA ligase 1
MNHKPMLAVDCGDLSNLTFPLIASPKLDGVRCIITPNGATARSLKPIPNARVQDILRGLPIGLDGELMVGPPTAPDVYRKTVSVVMSDDKPIDGLVFHVFDMQTSGDYVSREKQVRAAVPVLAGEYVKAVPSVQVDCLGSLERLEEKWTAAGYEGVILRLPWGPYKHGRSTWKEGFLLKLKRFVDGEAEVIGVTELMHNGNEAKTNELGRTARSHKKAGLVGAGVMGTLQVRDVKTGVEFEIGTGFTAEERKVIWEAWQLYAPYSAEKLPRLAKYKHFPVGAKDKPRHPVFIGWRARLDT